MKLIASLAAALALAACTSTGGIAPTARYNIEVAYSAELKAANLAADSGRLKPADAAKVRDALKATHDALAAGDLVAAQVSLSQAQALTPK